MVARKHSRRKFLNRYVVHLHGKSYGVQSWSVDVAARTMSAAKNRVKRYYKTGTKIVSIRKAGLAKSSYDGKPVAAGIY